MPPEYDIGIIDYQLNNLRSISNAFKKLGKKVRIITSPEEIDNFKALVLPGVGAFGDAMRILAEKNMVEAIQRKVQEQLPFLGICLGMQLIFSESEEFGTHQGLNLIEGKVIPFKNPKSVNIKGYRVPHMGWNNIESHDQPWTNSLLKNTTEGSDVYFVHSFHAQPAEKACILATTSYGNQEICAVVQKGNICGTQFHPEKSGEIGLAMLEHFCTMHNI